MFFKIFQMTMTNIIQIMNHERKILQRALEEECNRKAFKVEAEQKQPLLEEDIGRQRLISNEKRIKTFLIN